MVVDLHQLSGVCDLHERLVNVWGDAAAVMLDKFHAAPPPPTSTPVEMDGDESTMQLTWACPTNHLRESHANEKDATEWGAYAVAIAAAHHTGYRVRRRLHQGSGADMYMVRRGEPDNDYIKLEVSGIARGVAMGARVTDKAEQVAGGDVRRPGVALVVAFEAPRVRMERVP